ncbi:MAG: serine/threonine-protein kinase [Henriciella sp.]
MTTDTLEQAALEALALALDQPSNDRAAWVEETYADQTELKARILQLLDADRDAASVLQTGGASDQLGEEAKPERVGAYKITDMIGQGGMGAVYQGIRDIGDFDHTAAIKVIRPSLFSDALTERFERERQTLAQLNHPGIARLFDGGTLPDGSPYIIMELVHGVSLAAWIEENPSDQEMILDLFEQICSAVSYAHQNLIIHRDLTPTNVLVTADKTIKLIDFGIAMPQADERLEPATLSTQSLSFTPGFSAPERSQGAPANTLSDVYSLGKLLEVMLRKVKTNKDLASIIARASAQEPADRYASALALLDDIRNYRTGYPVAARNGGSTYRFGKYFGRRRLLVSFATLGALGLSTAFGVTLIQYQRAEAALERADARFEQARALSRSLVFEAYDEFAEVSGTLEPRRNLAGLLTTYVGELAEDENAPNDVLFDIGQMNSRLADIYGGLGMANLGDTDKSLDLLLEAEAALSQLIDNDPANSEALAELVFVRRGLSMQNLIYRLNPDEALRYNELVLSGAERGVALADENERTLLRHFWSGRTDRLQILLETRDLQTALSDVRNWRGELDDEMFERLGGGEEMATYLAVQEAEILIELDRPAEAIAPLQYAKAYRETQLEVSPEDYYQQTQLLVIFMELARAKDLSGAHAEALPFSTQATELARTIMAQDPNDAGGPEGLNSALQNHATFLSKLDRADEAVSIGQEALQLAQGLTDQFPGDPYYQRILMRSLITLADVSQANSNLCKQVGEARNILEGLNTSDASAQTDLTSSVTAIENLSAKHQCG